MVLNPNDNLPIGEIRFREIPDAVTAAKPPAKSIKFTFIDNNTQSYGDVGHVEDGDEWVSFARAVNTPGQQPYTTLVRVARNEIRSYEIREECLRGLPTGK